MYSFALLLTLFSLRLVDAHIGVYIAAFLAHA